MNAATEQLTARKMVESLLDPGSFIQLGATGGGVIGGGVIAGAGRIDDRQVCLFCVDSASEVPIEKIVRVFDLALKTGCPLIGIHAVGETSGSAAAGVLGRYGRILQRSAHASGVIPQFSLVLGETHKELVFAPALTDFVIMAGPTSQLVVSGPEAVRAVTGEDVSSAELGGGLMHATVSGTAHYLGADEIDAIDYLKHLLSYLPQNNLEDPPGYEVDVDDALEPTETDLALDRLIPDAPNQPYDMHEVIAAVLDDGEFCEVQARHASNIVVGYGRIDGRSVGVVANQPLHVAGCLDIVAAEKAARFIRTCDAFNAPVLTFVDAPGFVPGTDQEWNGISRHVAQLSYAYAEATVPLVTVVTRRATGGAYEVLGSRELGADINLAWPTAQFEAMRSDQPSTAMVSAELAVDQGYLDAAIKPHQTRSEVIRALRLLRTKRATLPPKKHGNIPL